MALEAGAIMAVPPIVAALERATTPHETKGVEVMAAAGRAYARERDDYEMLVAMARVYMQARRATTALILPHITPGRPGNGNVEVTILVDYGFTKQQWARRRMELEATDEEFDAYIDECIEMNKEPTSGGLVRYHAGGWVKEDKRNDAQKFCDFLKGYGLVPISGQVFEGSGFTMRLPEVEFDEAGKFVRRVE